MVLEEIMRENYSKFTKGTKPQIQQELQASKQDKCEEKHIQVHHIKQETNMKQKIQSMHNKKRWKSSGVTRAATGFKRKTSWRFPVGNVHDFGFDNGFLVKTERNKRHKNPR